MLVSLESFSEALAEGTDTQLSGCLDKVNFSGANFREMRSKSGNTGRRSLVPGGFKFLQVSAKEAEWERMGNNDLKDQEVVSQGILGSFNEALKENSMMTMLPSFEIKPNGAEAGNYLVLDVGGSTLRVGVISIASPREIEDRKERVRIIVERKWVISDAVKYLDLNFFRWIGSNIKETLLHQDVIKYTHGLELINTGVTWSFPLEQTSPNSGNIVHVGKGYVISPEIYNKDLKEILESTLRENFSISIDVKVILNDSTAVYCAGAFYDKYTKIALVLGTGINMCFPLKTQNIHPNKSLLKDSVLMNSELSLFGANLIRYFATKYDCMIDCRFDIKKRPLAFRPHIEIDPVTNEIFQPSELMVGGRYLCELVRLIVEEVIAKDQIFTRMRKTDLSQWKKKYEGFSGELMCFISETEDHDSIAREVCRAYHWDRSLITDSDVKILKEIVDGVLKRAAFIVSIILVSAIKLLDQNGNIKWQPIITIGYVGSIAYHFHSYRKLILKYVNDSEYIKKLGITADFRHINNSSITGAAIAAAYYCKREN